VGVEPRGRIGIARNNTLRQAFPNVENTYPYRVRFDSNGESQLQIGYLVPFSQWVAWSQFMLGYCTTLPLPNDPGGGQRIPREAATIAPNKYFRSM
jgi:hypothetical protein